MNHDNHNNSHCSVLISYIPGAVRSRFLATAVTKGCITALCSLDYEMMSNLLKTIFLMLHILTAVCQKCDLCSPATGMIMKR